LQGADEEHLSPIAKRRQRGSAKGQIWMSPDFDEPLEGQGDDTAERQQRLEKVSLGSQIN
jgi:hypothetical protein